MHVLIYIVSLVITLTLKISTSKFLYKKFGAKFIKYFNISTLIVAFFVAAYFMYIYTNSHPVYPAIFGGFTGLICGKIRINSDNEL